MKDEWEQTSRGRDVGAGRGNQRIKQAAKRSGQPGKKFMFWMFGLKNG